MIRTMTIEDYEQVHDLWMKIHGFGIRSVDDSKEGVERFLKRNPTTSVVAVEDDKIVGAILCGHDGRRGKGDNSEADGTDRTVERFFLQKSYRAKSAG